MRKSKKYLIQFKFLSTGVTLTYKVNASTFASAIEKAMSENKIVMRDCYSVVAERLS